MQFLIYLLSYHHRPSINLSSQETIFYSLDGMYHRFDL